MTVTALALDGPAKGRLIAAERDTVQVIEPLGYTLALGDDMLRVNYATYRLERFALAREVVVNCWVSQPDPPTPQQVLNMILTDDAKAACA